MVKWLFILLFFYLIYRLIQGPRRRKNPAIRFQFKTFRNRGQASPAPPRRPSLDEIEEAEFEDITEHEKKKTDA
ncbi:MAG: hypothetical protein EA360_11885 [Balneolaceae bacterium]|nr:MAG: hypothetical protein EA360_11885 [Balneolaceae bacterium]